MHVFKRFLAIILCLVGINAHGIAYLRSLHKPVLASAAVLCGSYAAAKNVKCYSWDRDSETSKTFPKDAELKDYPEFAKFATRYRCSGELEANKEQHFLKGSQIDRIVNAERMKRVIKAEELDMLEVPHKCLCKLGDGDYAVLSKRMELLDGGKPLSTEETRQVATLSEATGYWDFYGFGNVGRVADNKIGYRDTEDRSFVGERSYKRSDIALGLACDFQGSQPWFMSNGSWLSGDWLQDRAHYLGDTKTGEFGYTGEGDQRTWPISLNSAYDPEGIDFEKVKQELADYRSRK